MSDAMVCGACGAAVAPTDKFCAACGERRAAPVRPGGSSWKRPPRGRQGPQGQGGLEAGRAGGGRRRPRLRPAGARALGGRRTIEGQARGLQARSEGGGYESQAEAIWTFRVERYDAAGNRVLLVPVEMRGLRFEGSLGDGDWVRVHGRARSGTFHATQVENLTTGAVVRAKSVHPALLAVVAVFVALILGFIAWIGYTIVTSDPGPPEGWDAPLGAGPSDGP